MVGSVDYRMGRMEAEIKSLKEEQDEIRDDVKKILSFMANVKGGWAAIAAVGALSSAVTAGIMKFLEAFHK